MVSTKGFMMNLQAPPTSSKNDDAWRYLSALLPGGVNSPVRSGKYVGLKLPIMKQGEGAWIEDIDGRRYIDCCMSWGALLHGHADPAVVRAAQKAVTQGSTFGASTLLEGDLATLIRGAMPSMERIRFVSSGTESTMSAVRLARAATGRSLVVKFKGHYHGHADQFLVEAGTGVSRLPKAASRGVPPEFVQNTRCLPFNDNDALERFFEAEGKNIAAVIVEPVTANMGVVVPDRRFLTALRRLTIDAGSLLIFDEVVTGFRVGLGGAQSLFQISPDLTCLGKIIGGGFPAAAFGGRRDIMELLAPLGAVYQAGTLSGNPVAMSAGIAAVTKAHQPGFYDSLQCKMDSLWGPVEEFLEKRGSLACVQRCGSMATMFFGARSVEGRGEELLDDAQFRRFYRFMLNRGVYLPPAQNEAWFLSSAHNDEQISIVRDHVFEYCKENL
jgi:glutamate-1-semialdehyde 2,1-aminomutase